MNVFQAVVNHLHIDGITRTVIATRGFCVNLRAFAAVGRVILGHEMASVLVLLATRLHSTQDDELACCETSSYAASINRQLRKQRT